MGLVCGGFHHYGVLYGGEGCHHVNAILVATGVSSSTKSTQLTDLYFVLQLQLVRV